MWRWWSRRRAWKSTDGRLAEPRESVWTRADPNRRLSRPMIGPKQGEPSCRSMMIRLAVRAAESALRLIRDWQHTLENRTCPRNRGGLVGAGQHSSASGSSLAVARPDADSGLRYGVHSCSRGDRSRLDQLRCDDARAQIESVYRQGTAVAIPPGRVRAAPARWHRERGAGGFVGQRRGRASALAGQGV